MTPASELVLGLGGALNHCSQDEIGGECGMGCASCHSNWGPCSPFDPSGPHSRSRMPYTRFPHFSSCTEVSVLECL